MKRIIRLLVIIFLIAVLCLGITYAINLYKDDFDAEIADTLSDGLGKKARVILLAGQSNAAGCSSDEYLKKNVSAEHYEKYDNGFDNVYINYFASGTNVSNAFVKCQTRQGEKGGYFGPELGLAEKLNELYPDDSFFIIKYAWGGTNLYEQWLSPSSGEAGSLYKSFVKYVKASMEYLISKNYDVEIEGLCWMQGESDSMEEEPTEDYEQHLLNFIKDIRLEFKEYASDDGIAFVDAYIAEVIFWKYYIELNQAKQAVADSSPNNVVINTISHGLSVLEEPIEQPDIAHYDSLSEIKLGHLFAEEVSRFFDIE